ncbi:hypothetical protein NMY22_g11239 [Coprinellus aureogranulatus]|nr:hypothetical protein NMY22_g11239 [Coprinellus aureogranulatus]
MVYAALLGLLAASSTLVSAGNLYLYPPRSYATGLHSLQDASAAISRHLGLEMFESVNEHSKALQVEEDFVGKPAESYLLLTMSVRDAEAHTYPSVFDTWLLEDAEPLLEFFDTAEKPAFAAVDAHKLKELRQTFGPNSNEYYAYSVRVRQLLDELIHNQANLNIAILTYDADAPQPDPLNVVEVDDEEDVETRQTQAPLPNRPAPQQPIGAISSCFSTEEVCKNSTDFCSGHGGCVKASKAGRTCFVCTCSPSIKGEGSKKETTYWAGQSCEKKDISSTFTLLAGTTLVLIIVVFGSISLLYTVGDQALPSILLATAVNSKKD